MRYTREIGPDDAGRRVMVRRRLVEGGLGDLLGILEQWEDGVLFVRDRHGALHRVDADDVVASKRVPPPPERR